MAADERATSYETFVSARWSALYRTAYLLTGAHADAEDVLQATLVKAYTSWSRIQRADSAEAYVRRMLVNTFLSGRRRASSRRERLLDHATVGTVGSHEPDVLDRLALWAHVGGLPPRQRAVVVLRFYEDMSERQVAEALGCSPGTVKSQTSDALRSLRSRLAVDTETEGTRR